MNISIETYQLIIGSMLGLVVGSFLNVVIYRLPIMMEREWASQCSEGAGPDADANVDVVAKEAEPIFNLSVPRSRCQSCGHQIRWFENIPIASYIALKGKCSACAAPIGLRYPGVEVFTAALFAWCFFQWGFTWAAVAWCGFCAVLVTLALIDWDTTLLPDSLTLPLLWAGLIASALQWSHVDLNSSVWGAIGGYMTLWVIFWAFKLATGKEGMGYGDFKLLAALGAWFGWQALLPIIIMSSVIGAIVGLAMKFTSGLREGGYMPFGPFLVGAGLTVMVVGTQPALRAIGIYI